MSVLASFDWSYIWERREVLAEGLKVTFELAAIGIAGAFVVGLLLGAARAYRIPVISQLAGIYVELIRNTPILVQIFLIAYGLPKATKSLQFEFFTVACVALVLWGGAFNTENFRAGFEAVPKRYNEAALALGFGRIRTFLNISLPIGGRIALPSSINTYISVFKNTALMTAISVEELTNVAKQSIDLDFRTWEMIAVLAVTYLTLVWTLSALIRLLERRLALPEER
ncbi:MAG: amino acid ABC transporter permease [Actinobacteria bacterium]|nr:amino acid ABC transporter permease [Actinomycetota bacterium]